MDDDMCSELCPDPVLTCQVSMSTRVEQMKMKSRCQGCVHRAYTTTWVLRANGSASVIFNICWHFGPCLCFWSPHARNDSCYVVQWVQEFGPIKLRPRLGNGKRDRIESKLSKSIYLISVKESSQVESVRLCAFPAKKSKNKYITLGSQFTDRNAGVKG